MVWAALSAAAAGFCVAALMSGCGPGGPSGEPVSDPAYLAEYARLEDCVGVHRSAPRLAWGDTIDCPSGQHCCLASIGHVECALLGDPRPGLCGARGGYYAGAVELPRDCDQGPETLLALWRHEAGHHLGLEHGDSRALRCGA